VVANQWLQLDLLPRHLLMRHVALEPNLPECCQVQLVAWLQGRSTGMPRLLDQNRNS